MSKPSGLTTFDLEGFRRHFWQLPVQELWGVGPQMSVRLAELGIRTVADLANASEPLLKGAFGVIGPQLREAAQGHDDTPLVPYHQGVDPKSMGHEVTLPEDCDDAGLLDGTLLRLSDQVARRLRGEGFVGRTVSVKLRDHRFATRLRQRALARATDDHAEVYETARALLAELWRGEPVRLLGVTVASLSPASDAGQIELFDRDSRTRRLRDALDRVRDRLGEASLVPAGTLAHRGALGHVPFGAMRRKDLGGGRRDRDDDAPEPRGRKGPR